MKTVLIILLLTVPCFASDIITETIEYESDDALMSTIDSILAVIDTVETDSMSLFVHREMVKWWVDDTPGFKPSVEYPDFNNPRHVIITSQWHDGIAVLKYREVSDEN
jgi:hypothetical protein